MFKTCLSYIYALKFINLCIIPAIDAWSKRVDTYGGKGNIGIMDDKTSSTRSFKMVVLDLQLDRIKSYLSFSPLK